MFEKFFDIKRSLTILILSTFAVIFIALIFVELRAANRGIEEEKRLLLLELEKVARAVNNFDAVSAILQTLSIDPSVKKLDIKEIKAQFQDILKETGLFHNILIADPAGNVIFSTIEVGKIEPASDRLYFKRALKEKSFVWGEFAISRSTGKRVIHFAMPVLDENKKVLSVLVAVPVMERILPDLTKSSLDLKLLDENGVVVLSKKPDEIGKRYEHFEKISAEGECFVPLKGEYELGFHKIIYKDKVFAYFISEIKFDKWAMLKKIGFFNNLLILIILLIVSTSAIRLLAKKLIIRPLQSFEKELTAFKDRGELKKIEREFIGELETFKDVYNSFIDSLNEMHKALEDEKNFWLDSFNSIKDPVFIVDKDYKIIRANEGFFRTFNIEKERLNELHCYDILHNQAEPISICPHSEILNKDMATSTELFMKDINKWFLITYAPLHQKGGIAGTIHILTDITAQKSAEEEKIKIERQMLHTQKLESLGILAGGIAHDFNNLLMGILGNAELALLNKENLPQSVVQNVETIKKITEKAAHLTRQMLAYSGKGKFVIKEIDLNQFIRDIIDLIKVSISKKAVLSLNLNEKEPLIINGDPGQIEQVILNLVINASEALEEKEGLITIMTGKQYCDSSYFKDTVDGNIRTFTEGEYVYFEVTDTGCGMDRETMNKIFEPFFTTKFTGRGLGLSAILGIVRGHGGAIRVYSEKGKGSSLKILLPAGKATKKEAKDADITTSFKGIKVLIVDDESVVRDVTKRMVEVLGGEILVARDGNEAIEIFSKHHGEIDLVLLDLTMPGLSGEEVFREIKKIKADVKVILMSGYNDEEIAQRLVGRGFAGFIQKPFTVEKLISILNKNGSGRNSNN